MMMLFTPDDRAPERTDDERERDERAREIEGERRATIARIKRSIFRRRVKNIRRERE